MKRYLLLALLFSAINLTAQDGSHNWTVQLSAEVNDDPASITLKWLPNELGGETYYVWKKQKETVGWGTSIASIPAAGSLEFTDEDVVIGNSYEYMIQLRSGGSILAWSYINSGIQTSLNPNKGDLLLLVDERHADGLTDEIAVLEQDMYTDGWMVTTLVIDSTSTPQEVKEEILIQYNTLPNLTGLYLLGHVPVPYSGELYPDYVFNHRGAWPSDVYYAIMFGEFTDSEVNNTSAVDPRNHNVPGDGKFDQSKVPSTVNLQVSRVDFHNLTVFADSEQELLRNYLDRAHEFKMTDYVPVERGLFDQGSLAYLSEGYAQNAIRNFTAFFGPDSVFELDYWTTINSQDYLWSFGSGNGTYSLANDLNGASALTSSNAASGYSQSTFTMLYGTYFGDWDTPNNLMRSVVASGRTLACSWAGRPNWHYHHMALGENIGYSARASQDLYSDYFSLTVAGGALVTYEGMHVAQLGDPTLRMYYVSPPGTVTVENEGENASLSWEASADAEIAGYNVYRRPIDGIWTKVNAEIVTETVFSDTTVPGAGEYLYLVKATKLKINGSGSFYNESHGSEGTVEFVAGLRQQTINFAVYPNPSDGIFVISSNEFIDQVTVHNTAGQIVYQDQPNQTNVTLDLSELESGVYMLEIGSGEVKTIERLVVR